MLPLDYEVCPECNYKSLAFGFCISCHRIRFLQDFGKWTSGDKKIDEFIQMSQLQINRRAEMFEWIPYTQFQDVKYIAKGGYGTVYSATWKDGNIYGWDVSNKKWNREPDIKVALKSLDKLNSIDNLINEIKKHLSLWELYVVRCYGITQQPESLCYMMVLEFQANGSLRKFLDENFYEMNLSLKLVSLRDISGGLNLIHGKELVHGDFHPGNLLYASDLLLFISDLGLCKFFNENSTRQEIYGVLPYIAPEVLCGDAYTPAADIYSFGIVAYEMITGFPPYYNIPHDQDLAVQICQGLRPKIPFKTPKFLVRLIMQCWDARPSCRPNAGELWDTITEYKGLIESDEPSDIKEQVKDYETEFSKEFLTSKSSGLNYETHPNAFYTSRLLSLSNLSQPINSPDHERVLEMLSDNNAGIFELFKKTSFTVDKTTTAP